MGLVQVIVQLGKIIARLLQRSIPLDNDLISLVDGKLRLANSQLLCSHCFVPFRVGHIPLALKLPVLRDSGILLAYCFFQLGLSGIFGRYGLRHLFLLPKHPLDISAILRFAVGRVRMYDSFAGLCSIQSQSVSLHCLPQDAKAEGAYFLNCVCHGRIPVAHYLIDIA